MKKKYIIYITGRRAVCPECSGMALHQEDLGRLWCIDCNSSFEIKDEGRSDKEVICVKSA